MIKFGRCVLRAILVLPLGLAVAEPAWPANTVKTRTTDALPLEAASPTSAVDPAYAAFEDGRYVTAMQLAEQAAAKGEPTAHTLIGRLFAEGLGVQRDRKMAAVWYQKAADLGDINAKFALGLLYAKGDGVEKNASAAAKLFEQAAKGGNVAAKYNLGLLYASGEGRPQDSARAAALIAEAAKAGEPQARFDLGQMYANGAGLAKDDTQAAHWTELAAGAGLADAQVEFAVMLFKGRGVLIDKARAAWYFTAAAEHGNPIAQNRLANLYAFGIVYSKDMVTAAKWHLLARQAGVSDVRLDVMVATLTPDERKQAEADASQWLERVNPTP